MKTEIMNIEGKGLCLVISGFTPTEMDGLGIRGVITGPFSNPNIIANLLADGKKIAAIKEIRYQTGWGLRDAKGYLDNYTNKYRYMHVNENNRYVSSFTIQDYQNAANDFLKDHVIKDDFLKTEDMKI